MGVVKGWRSGGVRFINNWYIQASCPSYDSTPFPWKRQDCIATSTILFTPTLWYPWNVPIGTLSLVHAGFIRGGVRDNRVATAAFDLEQSFSMKFLNTISIFCFTLHAPTGRSRPVLRLVRNIFAIFQSYFTGRGLKIIATAGVLPWHFRYPRVVDGSHIKCIKQRE